MASLTGESSTYAVGKPLAGRLQRALSRRGQTDSLAENLLALGHECAALPDLDTRTPAEFVGYDDPGL